MIHGLATMALNWRATARALREIGAPSAVVRAEVWDLAADHLEARLSLIRQRLANDAAIEAKNKSSGLAGNSPMLSVEIERPQNR